MSHTDDVERAEALFAQGDLEGARRLLEQVVAQRPDHATALNDLGVVLHTLGELVPALKCFAQAMAADPSDVSATLNYVDALGALGRARDALPVLSRALPRHHREPRLVNALAAMPPTTPRRRRIAFFSVANADQFIRPIAAALAPWYDTQVHVIENLQQCAAPSEWADVVWLEWADALAAAYTTHVRLPAGKRVICRVHSYEALDGPVKQVQWDRVDQAIFVAPHILRITREHVPDFDQRVKGVYLVPNGIDLDQFAFLDRPFSKKMAYLGYINYRKGPMLLLHAFSALVKRDPAWELHIAGAFQDDRFRFYFEEMAEPLGLAGRIHHHGWIDDVPAWLGDKTHIVCTSVLEGHPVGLSEAMARGIKPLIHQFVGARGVFPERFLWRSIDEFVARATDGDYEPAAYRRFVEDHYSLPKQIAALIAILENEPARVPSLDFMPPADAFRGAP
jgi:glycosyltransferase involved in cell wall biosynthesis